ncbi:MAG TPA: hypothetical protein VFF20_04635 [Pseudogracilibacillus sp.]|nr:hypothetical protein [Pseudogracilibacillus sp.]
MQGWLLYSEADADRNEQYINWLKEEGQAQGMTISLLYRHKLTIGISHNKPTVMYENKPIALPDFAIVRTIEPVIQQLFEAMDIPSFNSFSVADLTNHKSRTYIEMNKLGVPILSTFFTSKKELPAEPPLPYPFIIKEATGRGGSGVHYINSEIEWHDSLSKIKSSDLVIQDAHVKLGMDLRVFVIGKEIIAAVLRKNDHDFRANYSLGGNAELYSLSDCETKLVQKIVDHFSFDLVGIDFLIGHHDELIFNEIEDVVGSRILSATTDINLLEKYMAYIKQTLTETMLVQN